MVKTTFSAMFCWIGCLTLVAQRIPNQHIQQLDRTLQQKIEQQAYCGLYCLVAQKDKVLLSKGYGKRDVEKDGPPTADTYYWVASMSKPVTSLAVLKVCEDKKIDLNTPLAAYFPFVADKTVSLRDMLSHTSGWGSSWNAGDLGDAYKGFEKEEFSDLKAFCEQYLRLPQIGLVGKEWHYGSGPDVMAVWIEQVTGVSFTEYVRKEVFEPLGMLRTGYVFPDDANSAYFHSKDGKGGWKKRVPIRPGVSLYVGSGALVSTPNDYFKFCQVLMKEGKARGKRLFPKKMIQEMRRLVIGQEGKIIPWQPGYGFGLGVSVRVDDKLAKMGGTIGDYGWFGFAGTSFWIDPARKIIGLVMTQGPYDEYKLNQDVKNAVYANQN